MTRLYDLGPFRLDVMIGAVTRAGMPTALGARAVAVLTVLVEHAHEFVSKRGLIDAAWPDVIVEESNLAVQIHAIRRVLSEAPGGEHWVETLAKRGYRFVGPVTALPNPGGRDSARSNLPEPVTSFVGRERDLVEIKRLLPTKRLVTLVGVGGIGKTRLAL
jgi:adenylate cyclase